MLLVKVRLTWDNRWVGEEVNRGSRQWMDLAEAELVEELSTLLRYCRRQVQRCSPQPIAIMSTKSQNPAGFASAPADAISPSHRAYQGFPLAVTVVDPETAEYIEVDQSLCDRLRCSPNELIHRGLVRTHPELGPQVIRELYRQLQQRGTIKFYTKQKIDTGETLNTII
jgi:hypothetical protein